MFFKAQPISLKTHHVYPEAIQSERGSKVQFKAKLIACNGDVMKSVEGEAATMGEAKKQCKKWIEKAAREFVK